MDGSDRQTERGIRWERWKKGQNTVIRGELKLTNHIFVTSYPSDKERLQKDAHGRSYPIKHLFNLVKGPCLPKYICC